MKLQGKTVLITGASSGIGKAFAEKCAKDKCNLILASRSENELNILKEKVEMDGTKALVVPTDVTKPNEVRNLFMRSLEKFNKIDVVFDNAGVGFIGKLQEITVEQIESMVDVNIKGQFIVAKFTAEVFSRQKFGHLIMTSSLAGLITLPQWSVYVGTKWAITGFSDSLRPEFQQFNAKVTTLHPGLVKTGFFDKKKANVGWNKLGNSYVTSEEVADVVYDAIFTNKRKVKIPTMAKTFSAIYRFLPDLAQFLIRKVSDSVEYHDKPLPEDEGKFEKLANRN